MGWAQIISEIGGGRYTIFLDFGEASRLASINNLTNAIIILGDRIPLQQAQVDLVELARKDLEDQLDANILQIVESQLSQTGLAYVSAIKAYEVTMQSLAKFDAKYAPVYQQLEKMKASLNDCLRLKSKLVALVVTEKRDVWCADYTTGAAIGTYVATIDVPGESDFLLIAPGCRSPDLVTDGSFFARELCSPEQAYLNAAILPNVQKYHRAYRTAVITSIDYDANTASVTLGNPHTSSAQGLNVNQRESFSNIQVDYLSCDAEAFEVGDDVVVQILNDDWSDAKVIGFVTDPRQCIGWPSDLTITVRLYQSIGTSPGTRPWFWASIEDGHCGVEISGIYSTGASIAAPASHRIDVLTPSFESSFPGFAFEFVGGSFGTFASFESTAWNMSSLGNYPAGSVPSGLTGVSYDHDSGVSLDVNYIHVFQLSAMAMMRTLSINYNNSDCYSWEDATAPMFVPFNSADGHLVFTDFIGPMPMYEYVAAALPTAIKVTRAGRTKTFKYSHCSGRQYVFNANPPHDRKWGMVYVDEKEL